MSPIVTAPEVIERAIAGDRQAFRIIYDQHVARVIRHVGRITGPSGDIEDIAQEVFVQAHRSLPRFRRDSSFNTWLYRLTFNVTVSAMRKRRLPVELSAVAQLGSSHDAWGKLTARESLRSLYAALNDVAPEQREAFLLYEVEGLSLNEIAELTGDAMNTVASRVRRTRERLRALLEITLPTNGYSASQAAGGKS